ncbi:hypothetical protein MPSEU_000541900 [Mayamaea pseudoterrestris]|nr:hypothetical protein MPSEU_000541900 [Mayamaea pseudoterrestris]
MTKIYSKQRQRKSLLALTLLLSSAKSLSTRAVASTRIAPSLRLSLDAQLLTQKLQLKQPPSTSLDAWLDADDDDDDEEEDFGASVSGYFRLLKSTGTEILEEDLQAQIDLAGDQPNLFLERKDASELEKLAMSSVIEQLPKRAVEALSKKRTYKDNLNFSKTRVTADQEIELARTIQQGAALQGLRQKLYEKLGRDPTKQEWASIAKLSSKDIRRRISDYRKAKHDLVTANIGLVHTIVNQQYRQFYRDSGLSRDDLVQEGSLGLLRAAELFDPSRGVRFSAYAVVWIKGTLQNTHIPELVKLPQREKTLRNKIAQAERNFELKHGRCATMEQLAEATGLSPEQIMVVQRKMAQAQRMLSLDYQHSIHSRGGGESSNVESNMESDRNMQSDADLLERTHLQSDLLATMARALDDREARLVRLRYGLSDGRPRTLPECAEAMGLSYSRVQQLAERCLKKLRTAAEAGALEEYLLTIA